MPKNYRLLKGIVITLGILIVAMIILLVVASVMKYNDQKRAESELVEKYQNSQVTQSVYTEAFSMNFSLEEGEEVLSADSSSQGILVSIGSGGTTSKIILIDFSGKIVGTINVN